MGWAVLAYVLASIGIGLWAARRVRTSQDFLLASRRLPLLWSVSLLFSTWFGAETILGASETFARGGLLAVIEDPFGSALCLLLVGVWLARPFYRLPVRTFGDFYAMHFGPWTERLATALMIFSYFGWIAAQLVALGQALSYFSGASLTLTIPLATLLLLSYTFWGGLWSVAAVDLAQNVVIIVGLMLLVFFLPESWWNEVHRLPEGFLRFTPPAEGHRWAEYIAAWMIIGLGSLPQQDMYQRVAAARSETTAVRAGIVAAVLYLTIGLLPLIGGMCVRLYHPEWLKGESAVSPILYLVERYLPAWGQWLFWGALISAIMSSASGGLLAPAALLSENLFARWHRFAGLWKARVSLLLVSLACALLALYEQNIYELVAESSIFSLVTLFWPMVVGLHAPRWRSPVGAIGSMLFGLAVYYLAKAAHTALPPMLYGFFAGLVAYGIGVLVERVLTFRSR